MLFFLMMTVLMPHEEVALLSALATSKQRALVEQEPQATKLSKYRSRFSMTRYLLYMGWLDTVWYGLTGFPLHLLEVGGVSVVQKHAVSE